jgi:hypothetical protein
MQRWLLSVPATLDDIGKLFTELIRNLIAFFPGASKPRKMARNRIGTWRKSPAQAGQVVKLRGLSQTCSLLAIGALLSLQRA